MENNAKTDGGRGYLISQRNLNKKDETEEKWNSQHKDTERNAVPSSSTIVDEHELSQAKKIAPRYISKDNTLLGRLQNERKTSGENDVEDDNREASEQYVSEVEEKNSENTRGLLVNAKQSSSFPYDVDFKTGDNSKQAKRHQVPKACTNCQRLHVKCETERPCKRCLKNGNQSSCVDVPRRQRKSRKRKGKMSPVRESSPPSTEEKQTFEKEEEKSGSYSSSENSSVSSPSGSNEGSSSDSSSNSSQLEFLATLCSEKVDSAKKERKLFEQENTAEHDTKTM